MRDFTRGSIGRHIVVMAAPLVITTITQIISQLIDLYFIVRVSTEATAGVSAAGTAQFVILAILQALGVGVGALVAQAAGARDRAGANLVFNQSIILCGITGIASVALLAVLVRPFLEMFSADHGTSEAGTAFIHWLLPGFTLTFLMTALSSSIRGIGVIWPTIAVHLLVIAVNCLLAPVLIAGWLTRISLGASGAGLATSLSIAVGFVALLMIFSRSQKYLTIDPKLMQPRALEWRRILSIGWPSGGEMLLFFFASTIMFYAIRNFGASAQAGYGIGTRVMAIILLPGMSVALAAGVIVGQNFGARLSDRVKETFWTAAWITTAIMVVSALVVRCSSKQIVLIFGADSLSNDVAISFLNLVSWIFVARGLVFICSSVFQGLGNTRPALLSACAYCIAFAGPAIWMSHRATFRIEHIWYLSMLAAILQSLISLWLIRIEFRIRLSAYPLRTT